MNRAFAAAAAIALVWLAADPSFSKSRAPEKSVVAADVAIPEARRAIAEERFVDAQSLLQQALLAGSKDPVIMVLLGETDLARGRFSAALAEFRSVKGQPASASEAALGEGVALSLLNRSDEAVAALKKVVAEQPAAWRGWNALGAEYDKRGAFADADAAYEQALAGSGRQAAVLNNRGFSRLLRGEAATAGADFVEALAKDPSMAAARANLRLALAMQGQYARATAGGPDADRAMLLNNAGFAAMSRGDYVQAEILLKQALQLRGAFYGRAATNLEMAQALGSRAKKSLR